MILLLAGRLHTDVVSDMFALTVLQERKTTPDSAILNARKATMASALCAGNIALITILTSDSSAGSPMPGIAAQMTCQTPSGPAPSAHMEEESELSQNATLVTMQKDSAIKNASLATTESDQSAGDSASQVHINVVACARLTLNHAVLGLL